nr:MAG TPA: hypothetical protein [Caudoviricetes sp.]
MHDFTSTCTKNNCYLLGAFFFSFFHITYFL